MMNFKPYTLLIAAFLSLSLLAVQDAAAQLYRYKNEQGNLVLGQSIPPKFVSKGYDILNDQGRVIEHILPELTKAQISSRDAELERQKQLLIAKTAQDKIDEQLKMLYSHPDDAVRTLERRVQDIHSVIQIKNNKISNTKSLIQEQEELAANKQRKGLNIPKITLDKIKAFKKDIVNAQADIQELNEDYTLLLEEFDIKIKRLEVINEHTSERYAQYLKSLNTKNISK